MSQPIYVDVYIFGKLPNGFTQPSFLIAHNDYPAGVHTLNLTATVDVLDSTCPACTLRRYLAARYRYPGSKQGIRS
jgi:hypothetical protein